MKNKRILITGGLGFIGSGLCLRLLEEGYNVISYDFDMSSEAYDIYWKLKTFAKERELYFENVFSDLCNLNINKDINGIDFFDAVIHCAAYKSIAMSIDEPIKFYTNNVVSTMNLINWCNSRGIKKILFSSTAAVYDPDLWYCFEDVKQFFLADQSNDKEGWRTKNSDPYSGSKLICEQLFLEYQKRCNAEVTIFRYFNPIGTYKGLRTDVSDSMFGNGFRAAENNETFHIFGDNYPTEDGTCLRDYVDLRDIIDAHVKVLESQPQCRDYPIFNLGTGRAISVLECCEVIKKKFPNFHWDIIKPRQGDSPAGIANCDKIFEYYNWKSKYSISDAIDNYLKYSKK